MKINDIKKLAEDNNIKVPKYLDLQGSIELLLENSPDDYPEFFDTTKKLFEITLAAMFPNKDKKESLNKYLRRIIKENEPIIKLPDPKAELTFAELTFAELTFAELTFAELYQLDGIQQMRYINLRPNFDKSGWAVFKADYCLYD